jgi:hypothetical protein
MTTKELFEDFNSCKDDIAKWNWVKDHQKTGIVIKLDNDDTYGILDEEECEDDPYIFQFDNYIGWSDGVEYLLEAMGINAECV